MKVQTLIGPLSKGMGGEGIKQILSAAPRGYRSGIHTEQINDWPSVMACLARRPFDVLIAEFNALDCPSIDSLFRLQPSLAVIELDLVSRTTKVHVLDVGSDMLMALARCVAKGAGLTAERQPQPNQILPAAWPSQPATVRCLPAAADDRQSGWKPYRTAAEHLDDLREWLDLRLSLAIAQVEADRFSGEFPGWTISPERARRALGERLAAMGADDLREAWEEADWRLAARSEATETRHCRLPLREVEQAFELEEVERQMFRLTLAPELDGRYGPPFAFLLDDVTQRRPTPALLAGLIDGLDTPSALARLTAGERPLARYGLIRADHVRNAQTPSSQAPLAVSADIVDFVLADGAGPSEAACRLVEPADCEAGAVDPAAAPAVDAIRSARESGSAPPIVQLAAPAGDEEWLAEQLAAAGLAAVVGRLPRAQPLADLKEKVLVWSRWGRFHRAALIVCGLDDLDDAVRLELAEWLIAEIAPLADLLVLQGKRIPPTALGAAAAGIFQIARDLPSRRERADLWMRAAAERGFDLAADDARELAATFAFGRAHMAAATALAAGTAPGAPAEEALKEAARQISRASAPPAVRRIETGLGWDDIVLPPPVKEELRSIAAQVRNAENVWETWGFADRIPYGQGIAALFAGPSGTGKTMSGGIIARELGCPLYQVDLSKTVSKYLGETEKTLDGIFEAAEDCGAVLLLDEADALFGKRSAVKDSHDRYANVEISFLLQRIEAYRGVALLTTNLKQNLDPAFLRRLRFVIDFALPDAEQRQEIWTKMFPAGAPLAPDVDIALLARQLPLSGGSIEKSVLNAAFMAAESGGRIEMRHIVAATRRELAKLGMENAARNLTQLVPGERLAGGRR